MSNQNESMVDLPRSVPLVAIHGLVLMPRAQLPISMTHEECHIFRRSRGFVGVLQSSGDEERGEHFFKTGCVGRVVDMEMSEHKIVFDVQGVCRFDVEHVDSGYPAFGCVTYDKYYADLQPIEPGQPALFDRTKLIQVLKSYFYHSNVEANWDDIYKATDDRLIAALSMFCPLEAGEKQAVLETPSIEEQSRLIMHFLEINMWGASMRGTTTYH